MKYSPVPNTDEPKFESAVSFPTFKNVSKKREWMLEEMADAFRLFAQKGYGLGSAGHISVRDPEHPDQFWLNPLGKHFSQLSAKDMVLVDHEGNVIGGSKLPVNKAGFQIHGAIHRARPDVMVACHTHSIYGKAYSAFGKPVEMLSQDACIFYGDQAVYNDFGGIVLNQEEGRAIAEALGENRSLILQNHGLLTAGQTVGEAAFLFVLLEQTCQAQLLADASQYPKKFVSDEVAAYTYRATADPEGLWAEFQTEKESLQTYPQRMAEGLSSGWNFYTCLMVIMISYFIFLVALGKSKMRSEGVGAHDSFGLKPMR